MDRMWSRTDTATVRDVLEDLLLTRKLAYTTVMTVMDNLHRKGWLSRERDGRAWRYRPTATRQQHAARLMREALDASGDHAAAFTHFVRQMNDDESAALRAVLRRLPKRRTGT